MPTVSTKPIQYFGVKLSGNVVETPEGYLVFKNAVIARTGFQTYKGHELPEDELDELGISVDPNDDVQVYRSPEEVFSKRTIASFEGKPATDTHPGEMVDCDNHDEFSKGHIQNVRQGVEPLESGDMPLLADIFVTDKILIDKWKAGIRELSCGYNYHLMKDGKNILQVDIIGNHVAFVENGRAGNYVRVNDSKPSIEDEDMQKVTEFGSSVKTIAANTDEKTLGSFFRGLFNTGNKPIAMDIEHDKNCDCKECKAAMDKAASDAKAKDRKRFHDALDRHLDSKEAEDAEREEAEDADFQELRGLLAGGAGAMKSKSTNGLDNEEEYEAEDEDMEDAEHEAEDESEEEKEEHEAEDEAVETNPSPEIPSADRPKPVVPRAVDSAYKAGANAVLKALKPVIARSKDKRVRGAFDTATKIVRETKPAKGSYAKVAKASSRANDSVGDETSKRNEAAEKAYSANFRKLNRV